MVSFPTSAVAHVACYKSSTKYDVMVSFPTSAAAHLLLDSLATSRLIMGRLILWLARTSMRGSTQEDNQPPQSDLGPEGGREWRMGEKERGVIGESGSGVNFGIVDIIHLSFHPSLPLPPLLTPSLPPSLPPPPPPTPILPPSLPLQSLLSPHFSLPPSPGESCSASMAPRPCHGPVLAALLTRR